MIKTAVRQSCIILEGSSYDMRDTQDPYISLSLLRLHIVDVDKSSYVNLIFEIWSDVTFGQLWGLRFRHWTCERQTDDFNDYHTFGHGSCKEAIPKASTCICMNKGILNVFNICIYIYFNVR